MSCHPGTNLGVHLRQAMRFQYSVPKPIHPCSISDVIRDNLSLTRVDDWSPAIIHHSPTTVTRVRPHGLHPLRVDVLKQIANALIFPIKYWYGNATHRIILPTLYVMIYLFIYTLTSQFDHEEEDRERGTVSRTVTGGESEGRSISFCFLTTTAIITEISITISVDGDGDSEEKEMVFFLFLSSAGRGGGITNHQLPPSRTNAEDVVRRIHLI